MRYLPLSDEDRGEMLARIGVGRHRRPLRRRAGGQAPRARRPTCRAARASSRSSASSGGWRRGTSPPPRCRSSSAPAPTSTTCRRRVDHLIQRSEFLTSYTPYQPEIAQGTLQYLFEFQTQVANLTGMEVANASMYDGSTGTGEAVLMAHRVTKRRKAVLSGGLHPQYAEVVRTLSRMAGDEVVSLPPDVGAAEDLLAAIDDTVSCVVVQTPDFFGNLRDLRAASPTRRTGTARC